jgi:hypothetical protein
MFDSQDFSGLSLQTQEPDGDTPTGSVRLNLRHAKGRLNYFTGFVSVAAGLVAAVAVLLCFLCFFTTLVAGAGVAGVAVLASFGASAAKVSGTATAAVRSIIVKFFMIVFPLVSFLRGCPSFSRNSIMR